MLNVSFLPVDGSVGKTAAWYQFSSVFSPSAPTLDCGNACSPLHWQSSDPLGTSANDTQITSKITLFNPTYHLVNEHSGPTGLKVHASVQVRKVRHTLWNRLKIYFIPQVTKYFFTSRAESKSVKWPSRFYCDTDFSGTCVTHISSKCDEVGFRGEGAEVGVQLLFKRHLAILSEKKKKAD